MKLLLTFFILFNLFLIANEEINHSKLKLIWEDEFDDIFLNDEKWSHRYIGKRRDGYNTSENIILEDGILKIKIHKKDGRIYTAMIGTQDKFEVKYGYFESRIFLPSKHGSQSAFWLQSPTYGNFINNLEISGAEIDIVEFIHDGNQVYHTVHDNGYGKFHKSYQKKSYLKLNDWNTFGLLWDENSYKFYINGYLRWRSNKGISKSKQYIILSVEATEWAKSKVYVDEGFEDFMLVDYVKVYKIKEDNE